MKMAALGISAATALVLGFGLTARLAADGPGDPVPASVDMPAIAVQDVRASVPPDAGAEHSATLARQQVQLRDGAMVSVLRPVRRELASGHDEVVEERPRAPAWQVAAGGADVGIRPSDQRVADLRHQADQYGRSPGAAVRSDWLEVAAQVRLGPTLG